MSYEEHVEGVLRRMSLHAPSRSMSDINDARTRSSSGIGWWRNRARSAVMCGVQGLHGDIKKGAALELEAETLNLQVRRTLSQDARPMRVRLLDRNQTAPGQKPGVSDGPKAMNLGSNAGGRSPRLARVPRI